MHSFIKYFDKENSAIANMEHVLRYQKTLLKCFHFRNIWYLLAMNFAYMHYLSALFLSLSLPSLSVYMPVCMHSTWANCCLCIVRFHAIQDCKFLTFISISIYLGKYFLWRFIFSFWWVHTILLPLHLLQFITNIRFPILIDEFPKSNSIETYLNLSSFHRL